ncbi:MAG: FHA domain-containing protein [Armatimonadetes bacterium]|nr:FHA domain-containing protein [Armatimonadota bacterium]
MADGDSRHQDNDDIIEISAEDLDAQLPAGEDILVIDHEDLAEVREEPGAGPAPYPSVTEGGYGHPTGKKTALVGLLGSAVLQMAVAGLIGGFLAWAIMEPFITDNATAGELVGVLVEMAGFGAVLGGMIGLVLGSLEGLVTGVWEKAVKGGGLGLAIGGAGGAVGGVVGQIAYGVFSGGGGVGSFSGIILQVAARAFAWSLVGLFIGLGQGTMMGASQKIINGLIGGAVGGFLGGLLFDPISLVFGGISLSLTGEVSGWLSRMVGMSVLGLCTGAAIGMVEEIRKEAWLTIVAGPLKGKQFIIYRSPTLIGSSPKADICLVKDPHVAPEHAHIERERNRHVLVDLGAGQTVVNDQRISRRQLREGDYVTIGQTVLRYETRAIEQPSR